MRDINRRVRSEHALGRSSEYRSPAYGAQSLPQRTGVFSTPRLSRKHRWVPPGRPVLVFLVILAVLLSSGLVLKQRITSWGELAALEGRAAMESIRHGDLETGQMELRRSQDAFTRGRQWLQPFAWLPNSLGTWPGLSTGMTAEALFSMGEEGTAAALALFETLPTILTAADAPQGVVSMVEVLHRSGLAATDAHAHLSRAQVSLDRVRSERLPEEYRDRFAVIRKGVPLAVALLEGYVVHQALFAELLGANGPRIYLILFQNNHELRATGGFIGSYALLDVNQGQLRRFFVDGIFNPDGQLKENIVPPKPIQKISAAWSLHDSNWFPDFPTSAEKAMFFYEKTGGPTVDGIITLTPAVLIHILTLTGPITLPEYGVTIDADNFMPIIQGEVEVNYDKEENNPKKILGDLTEILLRRFLSFDRPKETWELGTMLADLLNQKHILLYARHPDIQQLIRSAGWSGEILETAQDYLSVVHTNINGFKTDGVIDEIIEHEAVIRPDGSVRDTVSVTRQHHGGKTGYAWWDKVNADYLRVYVPQGSKLLSAEGMTREFPEAPVDYDKLGFRRDPDIEREEMGTTMDDQTGTRISIEAGKTVFGNWVYVSPGESVTVRYTYELPFRVAIDPLTETLVTKYTVLYQKQSGTDRTTLRAKIKYPDGLEPIWQTPENLVPYDRMFEMVQSLDTDRYWGVVFGPKNKEAE